MNCYMKIDKHEVQNIDMNTHLEDGRDTKKLSLISLS